METPIRTVCAALWLSFCVTLALLAAVPIPFGNVGFASPLLVGLLLVGLVGAASARRIVPGLRWRELLAALLLSPILSGLFLRFIQIVFHLKSRDLGIVGEMGMILTLWALLGAFLLPIFDNDLRQKEPNVALHRAIIGVIGLGFMGLVGFGLLQKPVAPDWRWHQGGYAVLVFAGLPALFVTALGWLLGVANLQKTGAYFAALGTLAFCAVCAYWAATGAYFLG